MNGQDEVEAQLAVIAPELRPLARQALRDGAHAKPLTAETLDAMRKAGDAALPAPLSTVPWERRTIPVGRGHPDCTIYVINSKPGARRPAIVHTHGGGFVSGRAIGNVPLLQAIAPLLDATIVTIEYRLAPEATYAQSIEDNYAGLKWTYDHAEEIGVDRRRIALMGESAGGGHAAILAIVARDRGEVPVCFQCLVYPMLDDRTGTTVMPPSTVGRVAWTADSNRFGWRSFLGMAPGGRGVPPIAVPARCRDLRGLPPAFIGVGSVDLFVDEDIAYAKRLVDAGVATQLLVQPGAYHGFDIFLPEVEISKQFTNAKLAALRRALTV